MPGLSEDIALLAVGAPEYAERLMRALNVKGDLPNRVASRYELSFTLEDLTRDEFRWLRRTRTFECADGAAAVVGNFSAFELRPAAEVLTVVESVFIINNGATVQRAIIGIATQNLVGAVASASAVTDERYINTPSGAAWTIGSRVAASSVGFRQVRVAAGASAEVVGPWILTGTRVPATCLLVQNISAVNEAFTAGCRFYERLLLQTEL
jgi:hypothetical protein